MTRSPTAVDSPHMGGGYLDLRLGELLDRLSADGLAPGGGSAAALTVAFSARLVAMVARCSVRWDEAAGSLCPGERDRRARRRARPHRRPRLGGRAHGAPRRGGGSSRGSEERLRAGAEARSRRRSAARDRVARADAAALAALAAEHGEATYRADAAAAAALAAGGASAAAHLVRVNLGVRSADPRLARALASEQAAQDVAARLLESRR